MYIHIEDNNYLRIEACHYDSYDSKDKGIMVYLTKVERTEISSGELKYWSEKCTPMDDCNFRFFACKYKRKSQKKIDRVNDYMYDHQETILSLYECGDKYGILNLIQEVAK